MSKYPTKRKQVEVVKPLGSRTRQRLSFPTNDPRGYFTPFKRSTLKAFEVLRKRNTLANITDEVMGFLYDAMQENEEALQDYYGSLYKLQRARARHKSLREQFLDEPLPEPEEVSLPLPPAIPKSDPLRREKVQEDYLPAPALSGVTLSSKWLGPWSDCSAGASGYYGISHPLFACGNAMPTYQYLGDIGQMVDDYIAAHVGELFYTFSNTDATGHKASPWWYFPAITETYVPVEDAPHLQTVSVPAPEFYRHPSLDFSVGRVLNPASLPINRFAPAPISPRYSRLPYRQDTVYHITGEPEREIERWYKEQSVELYETPLLYKHEFDVDVAGDYPVTVRSTQTSKGAHQRVPPSKGEQERKVKTVNNVKFVKKVADVYGWLTEIADAIEAVYKVIDPKFKPRYAGTRYVKRFPTLWEKFKAILNAASHEGFDRDASIRELYASQAQDAFIGIGSGNFVRSLHRWAGSGGLAYSSASKLSRGFNFERYKREVMQQIDKKVKENYTKRGEGRARRWGINKARRQLKKVLAKEIRLEKKRIYKELRDESKRTKKRFDKRQITSDKYEYLKSEYQKLKRKKGKK